MGARAPIVVGLAIVGLILFAVSFITAKGTADSIKTSSELNEALAESAPQQQVVASWAIRDAVEAQVRADGVTNGLLAICAVMLGGVALTQGFAASPVAERRSRLARATRECPFCREPMRRDASVCPRCQRESEPWEFREGHWWKEDPTEGFMQFDETLRAWMKPSTERTVPTRAATKEALSAAAGEGAKGKRSRWLLATTLIVGAVIIALVGYFFFYSDPCREWERAIEEAAEQSNAAPEFLRDTAERTGEVFVDGEFVQKPDEC